MPDDPTPDGATWLIVICPKCRKRYSVRYSRVEVVRACPRCHRSHDEGDLGPRIKSLIESPSDWPIRPLDP